MLFGCIILRGIWIGGIGVCGLDGIAGVLSLLEFFSNGCKWPGGGCSTHLTGAIVVLRDF